jgi:hypothetical protein
MTRMRPHDRRRHPRLPADAVAFLSAQLVGGSRVKLLDVSHGGVRLETARHVRPGQTLAVRFSIGDEIVAVTAAVVRATVSSLTSDRVCYETALQLLEDPNREQFQLALANRGREAHETQPDPAPLPPGLDVVLIADHADDARHGWWLAGGGFKGRPQRGRPVR